MSYRAWELWLARTGRWGTRRWTVVDAIVARVVRKDPA